VASAAALCRKAAKATVAQAGIAVMDGAQIAVCLADDAAVRVANRQWRAKDRPTNVLSFPAAQPAALAKAPFLGDVILAYETVASEAEGDGKPVADHLTHLVVHGVLHLLGHDHMTAAEAEIMERLEITILASLGVTDPYAGSTPLETTEA
jgi:probable rRNA maturation factor